MAINDNLSGEFQSPGGFVFGVQGWNWGDQRPMSITFFLDGTCKVCDQHGRPIKGFVRDGQPVYMDKLTHAQVIEQLTKEFPGMDWQKLACAGWPQLPYAQLKQLKSLPPTPIEELKKIQNTELRKDALRARREASQAQDKELQAAMEE